MPRITCEDALALLKDIEDRRYSVVQFDLLREFINNVKSESQDPSIELNHARVYRNALYRLIDSQTPTEAIDRKVDLYINELAALRKCAEVLSNLSVSLLAIDHEQIQWRTMIAYCLAALDKAKKEWRTP